MHVLSMLPYGYKNSNEYFLLTSRQCRLHGARVSSVDHCCSLASLKSDDRSFKQVFPRFPKVLSGRVFMDAPPRLTEGLPQFTSPSHPRWCSKKIHVYHSPSSACISQACNGTPSCCLTGVQSSRNQFSLS